ncbi:MAG: nucleotidyltransferase family protein [Oscillospiraceae bacterium]|nr:nucleotidyltransferase family protein [Oscillospiraceae bacterium]
MQVSARTSEYLLELLRSVLHNRLAAPKPEDVSWDDLFEYAKSQSLSTMAYRAIQASGFDIGSELSKEWSTLYSRNLVTNFNQEHECERLCERFSAAGIRNMPLKGSVIRKIYPAPELREMCDLDILVKPEDIERAHEIMLAEGYTYLADQTTSHNRDYHKLPYLNVEIHNYLLPRENKLFFYYADFWDKATYEAEGLTCRMNWNDGYIYMLAHAYKHFFKFGTGIRSVLDVYFMRNRLNDTLQREYIVGELKKLGLLAFAESFERLADCWFAEEATQISQELLQYHYRVLESGTYGDSSMKSTALKIIQDGKSLRTAKLLIALSEVFPPYKNMKEGYPCLKYVPFLLPLLWVVRWVKIALLMPNRISSYFHKVKNLSLLGNEEERR